MAKMVAYENVADYIKYWMESNDVELHEVKPHADKAYASPAHSNHMVLGGIGFKLYVRGRPVAERQLMQLCCAGSMEDGYAASANQIKCGLTTWLFDKSAELCNTVEADTVIDWRPGFIKATSADK